jgi:hypothetical protein
MDYAALLLQTLSQGQLEDQVAEKIAQFHGLLTREVALKLIAREKGLVKEEGRKADIRDIPKGGKRISVEASARKIWPVAEYASGKRSRVVELEDGTGAIPLVLWNEDTKLANGLRARDRVLVKGAYEKGGELHLGYSGTLALVEKAAFSDLGSLAQGEFCHVQGFVSRVDGLDRYVSGTSAKLGFSFYISDGKSERQVVIWGRPERGMPLKAGDEIILESALESGGRLELSEDARLLVRRRERMLLGKVESLEAESANGAETLMVNVGGREAHLDRENGLRLMGLELAPDISLATAVALKKKDMLNGRMAVRVREQGGRTLVEG